MIALLQGVVLTFFALLILGFILLGTSEKFRGFIDSIDDDSDDSGSWM